MAVHFIRPAQGDSEHQIVDTAGPHPDVAVGTGLGNARVVGGLARLASRTRDGHDLALPRDTIHVAACVRFLPKATILLDGAGGGAAFQAGVFGSKPQKLKDDTIRIKVEGKKLSEGWYTLTAVSADNPNEPKSVSFSVTDNC
jgi:hypothetical protein